MTTTDQTSLGAGYRPRPLRFLRHEQLGGWRLKIYGISALGEYPRDELVEATLALAAEALPQPALGDERYGVGFVTAHEAASLDIALVYWWQWQNELHQRVFTGTRADPPSMTRMESPGAGCVWELGIVDFERRAWLEDVLTNPAGPDLELYLSRELATQF